MNSNFSVGDKVTLTNSEKRHTDSPERYQIGEVVRVGAYNVYDVLWNGFVNPVGMRGDEIELVEQED